MLKKWAASGVVAAIVFLSLAPARAEETVSSVVPAPVAVEPPAGEKQDPPLTVSNVTVDKTDKNAVLARTAAIAEAKRAALQKLAERNMDAEALKGFKLPDDQAISALVQDFEITSEQLSATRYVATFTVRFTPQVEAYVKTAAPAAAVAATAAPAPDGSRSILVLPYLETADGRLLLWEDGNAWLKAWQASAPEVQGWTVTVPLGDIGDIAAGSTDAVWSGNYGEIRQMLKNYSAEEAVLAVANRAGDTMSVDLYSFKDGRLDRLPSLTPVVAGEDDAGAFRQSVGDVMRALQKQPPPAAPAAAAEPVTAPVAAPDTGVPVAIEAGMNFDNAARWMEMQKRLTSLTPPATVEIKSLSSGSAAFTLKFNGSLATLRVALAAHGIDLGEPAVPVGEPGAQTAEKPVYDLRLVN